MKHYLENGHLIETTKQDIPKDAIELTPLQFDLAILIRKHGKIQLERELRIAHDILIRDLEKRTE